MISKRKLKPYQVKDVLHSQTIKKTHYIIYKHLNLYRMLYSDVAVLKR